MSKNGFNDSVLIGNIMEDGELYNPKLHRRFLVERVMFNESRNSTDRLYKISRYYVKQLPLMMKIESKLFNNFRYPLKINKFLYSKETVEELLFFNRLDIIKESLLILGNMGYIYEKDRRLTRITDITSQYYQTYMKKISEATTYKDLFYCADDAHFLQSVGCTELIKTVRQIVKSLEQCINNPALDPRFFNKPDQDWLNHQADQLEKFIKVKYMYVNMLEDITEIIRLLRGGDYVEVVEYYYNNQSKFKINRRISSFEINKVGNIGQLIQYNGENLLITIRNNYRIAGLYYAIYNQSTFKDYYGVEETYSREQLFDIAMQDALTDEILNPNNLRKLLKINGTRY